MGKSKMTNGACVLLGLIAMSTKIDAQEEKCGLWLGPSPIKEAEDHGWGHSMFTGKFIKKGTIVLGSGVLDESKSGKVSGDMLIPVYDWESIDMGSFANMDDNFYLDDDNVEKRQAAKERMHAKFEKLLEESKGQDPPLFHQLWDGNTYEKQVLESDESMRVFVPGASTLCPCTWNGFNLEQIASVKYRDWRNIEGIGHDESPPSSQAGSFTYLSNAMFRASRDIQPGEELVVECSDNSDDFDAESYGPTKFKPKEAGGYSICLDDKVEERLADHTPNIAGGSYGGQRGLFAKRKLNKGEVLTSTPMIPVHKEEMTMEREKYLHMTQDPEFEEMFKQFGLPPQKKQLLLNYMFGHAESSLLWLALLPLILSVNHAPHNQKVQPNAKIQWHKTDVYPDKVDGKPLTRRQQFHHAELLTMDSTEVALKHGMGLMVDLVALRDIQADEEILIDYGKDWDDAWKEHTKVWDATIENIKVEHTEEKLQRKQQRKREREDNERNRKLGKEKQHKHHQVAKHVENAMTALPLSSYVTAEDYDEMNKLKDLRTVTEQRRNPYPSNIATACWFEYDWLEDEDNNYDMADTTTSRSWYEMEDAIGSCLLPCIVTERRDYEPLEEQRSDHYEYDDDDYYTAKEKTKEKQPIENGGSATSKRYTVKLFDHQEENTAIPYECHIFTRFDYYMMDVPREGIVFVNKAHSTDQWIDQAFRQPIAMPDEMVPTEWKDLSRRKGTRGGNKKKASTPVKKMTEEEEQKEKEYESSVKKWNEVESRRERLLEQQEKWMEIKYSPLGDL